MDTVMMWLEDGAMKEIPASEFNARCLEFIDAVDEDGIVITKHGKPVAKLVPVNGPHGKNGDLIGIAKRRLSMVPDEELESMGDWVSDEWGETG